MATKKMKLTPPPYDRTGHQVLAGHRIEVPPGSDLWMRGARFGEVRRTEVPGILVVKMDHSSVRKLQRFQATDCKRVDVDLNNPLNPGVVNRIEKSEREIRHRQIAQKLGALTNRLLRGVSRRS